MRHASGVMRQEEGVRRQGGVGGMAGRAVDYGLPDILSQDVESDVGT